jgi:hypothetical protein
MTRLLTLTGPGACGKMRLALELTRRLLTASQSPDGIWRIDLVRLADPTIVPQTVAATLRLGERRVRTLTDPPKKPGGPSSDCRARGNCTDRYGRNPIQGSLMERGIKDGKRCRLDYWR